MSQVLTLVESTQDVGICGISSWEVGRASASSTTHVHHWIWNADVLWANWHCNDPIYELITTSDELGRSCLSMTGWVAFRPTLMQEPKGPTAGTPLSELTYVTSQGWEAEAAQVLSVWHLGAGLSPWRDTSGPEDQSRPEGYINDEYIPWTRGHWNGSNMQDMLINHMKLFCFLVAPWRWKLSDL